MNDIERLERVTQSAEYQMYSGIIGAAIGAALVLPTKAERDQAMRNAVELQKKLAEIVRRG